MTLIFTAMISLLLLFSVLKWSKPLMVIILMEGSVVMVLCMLFQWITGLMMLAVFSFFVGEALVLLTSFFGALRISGNSYGFIFFY